MIQEATDVRDTRWWLVYVIIPLIGVLIGSGGIVALFNTMTPSTLSPTAELQLEVEILAVTSGRTYFMGQLHEGATVYTDRGYIYSSVPGFLADKPYIITANEDKFGGRDFDFQLKLYANHDVTVYVAHSDRYVTKPDWLSAFQDTNADLTYKVDNDEIVLSLFEKRFSKGQIILGGNITPSETDNHAMYAVMISN